MVINFPSATVEIMGWSCPGNHPSCSAGNESVMLGDITIAQEIYIACAADAPDRPRPLQRLTVQLEALWNDLKHFPWRITVLTLRERFREDAEAGDVTRYRVVGEHHGHDPAESGARSCSQAMTHAALCHRIGRCDRVAVLEERLVRGRPASPWALSGCSWTASPYNLQMSRWRS